MATFTRAPAEATHRAEVIFSRDLSILYGIDEIETDFEVAYFYGHPTEADLASMVPYGWVLVEQHVTEVDELDLDEDDEESFYAEPYIYYFENDDELELGELALEVV